MKTCALTNTFQYTKADVMLNNLYHLREVENLDFMVNDGTTHGVQFQNSLESTCAIEMKKIFPPHGRRGINHWWNDELSELRRATLRLRRRAQQAVTAGKDNAGHMVTEFKEARRRLRRAIERCKEERREEFCATLDQDHIEVISSRKSSNSSEYSAGGS